MPLRPFLVPSLALLSFPPILCAQVASLSPPQPRWGAQLEISYDPNAQGASFTQHDSVYAAVYLYREDNSRSVTFPLGLVDGVFRHTFDVETGTSYVSVRFLTLEGWDQRVNPETKVYRPDGKPARGAHGHSLFAAGPQEYQAEFQNELEHYPSNYAAYRDKWFAASAFEKDQLEEIVRADMKRLEAIPGEPIGLLYARSYGHLLLGQERPGRELLAHMLRDQPTSYLTRLALSSYEYQVFARQIEGDGPESIEKLKRETIRTHPESEIARSEIYKIATDPEFPLAAKEAVCREWIADQPKNPEPYLNLSVAYLTHEVKLEEALGLAEASIQRLLAGELRLIDDVSGGRSAFFLPYAYQIAAKIARQRREYPRAIAYTKAARDLTPRSKPSYSELEAEIWEEIGYPGRAETAYIEAWKRGSKTARAHLERLFVRRRGSPAGFLAYLAELEGTRAESDADPAPAFVATSLDGKTLELDSLRGKIVVLNFWFIGCAPCRVEIPGLNELVKDYRDREVVFIAFATDSAKNLKSFLKKRSFDYQVVAESAKIAHRYGISGYPTHVIIDQKGQLAATLTGGSKTRHEDLRPVIDRLLGVR